MNSIVLRPGLPRRRRSLRPRCSRGSALFAVLILAVVMAVVFGAIITYVRESARLERRSSVRLESLYSAEFAFEKAYTELRGLLKQHEHPNLAQTTAVTNLGTAPTTQFPASAGYTWKSYLTVPTENGLVVNDFTGGTVKGTSTYRYLTVVEFDRSAAGLNKPLTIQLQREWIYVVKPLFQFAIFYDDNMELFPGANFVVGGRVHSNGTIYTATSASITFRDWVTNVSGIVNHYSPNDPRTESGLDGTLTYIKAPVPTTREEPPGTLTKDLSDANHNNDGARELIEIPRHWEDDPSGSERMYNKAGLKILVNTSNAVITADSNVDVPAMSGTTAGRKFVVQDGTQVPATDPLATYLNGLISTGSMQDYREDAAVTTTNLDVGRITAAYNEGGLPQTIPNATKWPNNTSVPAALRNQDIPANLKGKALWNGIVYVADLSDSSTHPVGVKIVNGSSLPDGTKSGSPVAGLSIVSNNAAYLTGNYNTGANPAVNSGEDLGAANYDTSTNPDYKVQPAAVMADAVTIVSASWNSGNYNTKGNLNDRPAANTTINTALISGIVKSVKTGADKAYSGGVENYIRLLENWSGKRLTYYGSMINLYESQQATAKWQTTGNYYNAPTRNWYFDVNFRDPSKQPPGTPMLRSVKRGQWVQFPRLR